MNNKSRVNSRRHWVSHPCDSFTLEDMKYSEDSLLRNEKAFI